MIIYIIDTYPTMPFPTPYTATPAAAPTASTAACPNAGGVKLIGNLQEEERV